MEAYFADLKEVYENLKLANNGYTKVTQKIRHHVDCLVELGKVVYITSTYVEVKEVARETFFNPK